MALRKRINVITKDQIRAGQVLEIQYVSKENKSSKDLILVVDPIARTAATTGAGPTGVGQGRKGTLHAIKLQGLSDYQLVKLIDEVRTIKDAGGLAIQKYYEKSPYSGGVRNYRTYLRDGIQKVSRVTIGQPASRTNKIILGNSVLYGINHGKYVELLSEEYDLFVQELTAVGGHTYYEGPIGHENVTEELIKLTGYTGPRPPASSWEPTIENKETARKLYRITEIFGPSTETFWEQLNTIEGKNELTLVAVIEKWSNNRHSQTEIRELVELAKYPTTLLDTPFKETDKATFRKFHEDLQLRAFPEYEGDAGKPFLGSPFQRKQELVSRIRRSSLIKNMKENPGIYFAGFSHVDKLKSMGY